MAYHNELGQLGEEIALSYLRKKGYVILARNYRFQKAEIDIIGCFNDQLIIVEVKTRNSAFFGDPQDFVTKTKIKLLIKAAHEFVISNGLEMEVRFDIVAVLKNNVSEQVEHIENAFYHF